MYGNCDGDILKKICPSSIHKNECDFLPVKNEIISELKYLKNVYSYLLIYITSMYSNYLERNYGYFYLHKPFEVLFLSNFID